MASDNEIWLDRDLPLVVASVEPNERGGFDMHVVVLPKKTPQAGKAATEASGNATAEVSRHEPEAHGTFVGAGHVGYEGLRDAH